MKNLLLLSLFGIASSVYAQNLIQNGSFENYTGNCSNPSPNGDFHMNITDWYAAGPDINHGICSVDTYCGQANYSLCSPGPNGTGSDGSVYAGFHTRSMTPPYNEAIYQILSSPLVQGSTYAISIDLMTCQSGMFNGTDDFHVYANIDSVVPICPTDAPSVQLLGTIPIGTISNSQWQTHTFNFTAPANCNVIIFSGTCGGTETYYYIDNVILTNESAGLEEINSSNEKKLVKTLDIMGRETKPGSNVMVIHVYSDGTTQKVLKVD